MHIFPPSEHLLLEWGCHRKRMAQVGFHHKGVQPYLRSFRRPAHYGQTGRRRRRHHCRRWRRRLCGNRGSIEIVRGRNDIWTRWWYRIGTKGEGGGVHHQIRYGHQVRVGVEGHCSLVPREVRGRHPILEVDYGGHVHCRFRAVNEIVVPSENS